MKKTFAIILCAVALCGCATSNDPSHLSDTRFQQLVTEADQWSMTGGPLPDAITRLNPIQVYGDHGNIVIALHRDADGEQGLYIVPSTSSYDPRFKPDFSWTFTPVNMSDPYLSTIFEYSRK